jgi:hypothetical protein
MAEAARLGNGWVYIIDQRTPTPGGQVPPEDIIGAFEVKDGDILPGSYRASPNHMILSPNGFSVWTRNCSNACFGNWSPEMRSIELV